MAADVGDRLLEVDDLEIGYHVGSGVLRALAGVSFSVRRGEIVGIVGESGCGKTTLASALLRLLPPNGEICGGSVLFRDRDLRALSGEELRQLRGQEIAMIFQEPMTSLNPTFTVGRQMIDVQRAHLKADRSTLRKRALELLEQVGIPDAAERLDDYPHQFSGGMRQRIMIAMALLLGPALLIADEPTSALDVTLEAQIVELLRRLRDDLGTAILFVSHDLGVISQLCDRVVVMYAGRAVEAGPVDQIFGAPRHPYTQALLAAVPSARHRGERLRRSRPRAELLCAAVGLRVPPTLPARPGRLRARCPARPRAARGQPRAVPHLRRGRAATRMTRSRAAGWSRHASWPSAPWRQSARRRARRQRPSATTRSCASNRCALLRRQRRTLQTRHRRPPPACARGRRRRSRPRAAGRSSAWSASPAPARRRSAERSSASLRSLQAASCSTGKTSQRCRAAACAGFGAEPR
jgi:oligopeptide transport system ATP-binding protein